MHFSKGGNIAYSPLFNVGVVKFIGMVKIFKLLARRIP